MNSALASAAQCSAICSRLANNNIQIFISLFFHHHIELGHGKEYWGTDDNVEEYIPPKIG